MGQSICRKLRFGKRGRRMRRSETGRVETESRNSGASEVDARIEELGDWRRVMLARLRAVIKQADPDVVEECKWKKPSNPSGVPVWSHCPPCCRLRSPSSSISIPHPAAGQFPQPHIPG